MGWGKRQIPLISPWLASVIFQNFEFPHPFSSNSKQCREFSPAQGQRSQFIPLYSPTYSPGWPGVLPQGQADDMCIRPACRIMSNQRKPRACRNKKSLARTRDNHIRLCNMRLDIIENSFKPSENRTLLTLKMSKHTTNRLIIQSDPISF